MKDSADKSSEDSTYLADLETGLGYLLLGLLLLLRKPLDLGFLDRKLFDLGFLNRKRVKLGFLNRNLLELRFLTRQLDSLDGAVVGITNIFISRIIEGAAEKPSCESVAPG